MRFKRAKKAENNSWKCEVRNIHQCWMFLNATYSFKKLIVKVSVLWNYLYVCDSKFLHISSAHREVWQACQRVKSKLDLNPSITHETEIQHKCEHFWKMKIFRKEITVHMSNLLITYRSTPSGEFMRETGSICGGFPSFSVTWLIQHSPMVQFYCRCANSWQFQWDNIFNKQDRNFRSAQVCGSQTISLRDLSWGTAMGKMW